MTIRELYVRCIEGTLPRELVRLECILIGNIESEVLTTIGRSTSHNGGGVFLGTIALKHIHDRHVYDKNAPKDFDIILDKLAEIVISPDRVYQNLPGKRAQYVFVETIDEQLFLSGIDISDENAERIEIVSAFATGKNYLRKFTLLWSREDG